MRCEVSSAQNGPLVSVQNKTCEGFWYYQLIAKCNFSKKSRKIRFKQQPVVYLIVRHGCFRFFSQVMEHLRSGCNLCTTHSFLLVLSGDFTGRRT